MEGGEVKRSPPSSSSNMNNRTEEVSVVSRMKKHFVSLKASVQESFQYLKAILVGQAKKVTARTEKEATEADLQTAKMQVEATDAAEESKKKLDM